MGRPSKKGFARHAFIDGHHVSCNVGHQERVVGRVFMAAWRFMVGEADLIETPAVVTLGATFIPGSIIRRHGVKQRGPDSTAHFVNVRNV